MFFELKTKKYVGIGIGSGRAFTGLLFQAFSVK